MEMFNPTELCADIKIYDYKKKVKYRMIPFIW